MQLQQLLEMPSTLRLSTLTKQRVCLDGCSSSTAAGIQSLTPVVGATPRLEKPRLAQRICQKFPCILGAIDLPTVGRSNLVGRLRQLTEH